MATLVVVIVALWTLVILARPLVGWKLWLIAGLVAAVVLVVLVPPVGHGIFLLEVTPQALAVAAVMGAAGAVLVELASRATASLADRSTGAPAVRV